MKLPFLLVDEKREIEGLQRELELIESYLKDMDEVERQQTVSHVLQTKDQHLRRILLDIENFLDTVTDQKHYFKKLKAFFSCASNPLIQKHHLVEEIAGNMVLLRYLGLWECVFSTGRMDFTKNLRNLQTFDFYGSDLELSDNMFGSMEQLRVLSLRLLRESRASPAILMGVDKLRNLQTLDIEADEWIVKELPAISTDLQELKIEDIDSQPQLDAILCFVNSNPLTRLETLELILQSGLLEFDLQKMELERCQHLKFLRLYGKIKKQRGSRWSFPPNLLSLDLVRTEVEEEDDMNQVIAEVAHLRELTLAVDAYKGGNLTMSGLPKLQELILGGLPSLKEWRITEGSLPQLRELRIRECSQLERISD